MRFLNPREGEGGGMNGKGASLVSLLPKGLFMYRVEVIWTFTCHFWSIM